MDDDKPKIYPYPEGKARSRAWVHLGFYKKMQGPPNKSNLNMEKVNMTDRFGQVMIDNLKTRDCVLMGVEACTSMDSQKHRFTSQGWQGADGMDMSQVYKCLPDIHRIERIEFMDEKELLDQLLSHYCIVWAWKDPHDLGLCDMTFT